jgi:hypothetical protein
MTIQIEAEKVKKNEVMEQVYAYAIAEIKKEVEEEALLNQTVTTLQKTNHTRAAATLLPSAFPSSLSVGAAVAPSNHGAANPPCHAQATSRQDSVAVIGLITGEGKKRGIDK